MDELKRRRRKDKKRRKADESVGTSRSELNSSADNSEDEQSLMSGEDERAQTPIVKRQRRSPTMSESSEDHSVGEIESSSYSTSGSSEDEEKSGSESEENTSSSASSSSSSSSENSEESVLEQSDASRGSTPESLVTRKESDTKIELPMPVLETSSSSEEQPTRAKSRDSHAEMPVVEKKRVSVAEEKTSPIPSIERDSSPIIPAAATQNAKEETAPKVVSPMVVDEPLEKPTKVIESVDVSAIKLSSPTPETVEPAKSEKVEEVQDKTTEEIGGTNEAIPDKLETTTSSAIIETESRDRYVKLSYLANYNFVQNIDFLFYLIFCFLGRVKLTMVR